MRRIALTGLVALVLGGLAVAAVRQNSNDVRSSALELLAAWKRVGGSIVEPSLQSESPVSGLDCFGYELAGSPAWQVLCFDGEGRLLESLGLSTHRYTLASVATTPGRAPIRVSATALAHGFAVAQTVANLDQALRALALSHETCQGAIVAATRRLRTRPSSPRERRTIIDEMGRSCASAALAAVNDSLGVATFSRTSAAARRLVALAHLASADAAATRRIRQMSAARARLSLRVELRLESSEEATLGRFELQTRAVRRLATGR